MSEDLGRVQLLYLVWSLFSFCFAAQVAQAVLVPLLVDKDNVGPTGVKAIQSMMVMQPTPDFQVGVTISAPELHK